MPLIGLATFGGGAGVGAGLGVELAEGEGRIGDDPEPEGTRISPMASAVTITTPPAAPTIQRTPGFERLCRTVPRLCLKVPMLSLNVCLTLRLTNHTRIRLAGDVT